MMPVNGKNSNCLIDWNGPNIPCNGRPLIPIPSVLDNSLLQSTADDNPFDAVERQIIRINNDPFDVFKTNEHNSDRILGNILDNTEVCRTVLSNVTLNEIESRVKADECMRKLINISPKFNLSDNTRAAESKENILLNIPSSNETRSKIDYSVDNNNIVSEMSINEDYIIRLSNDEIIKYVKNRVAHCIQNTLKKLETNEAMNPTECTLLDKLKSSSSVSPCVLENLKYRSRLFGIIDNNNANTDISRSNAQSSLLETLDLHIGTKMNNNLSNNQCRNLTNHKITSEIVRGDTSFDILRKRNEFLPSITKIEDGAWDNLNIDFGCDLLDENISSITPCLNNFDVEDDDENSEFFIKNSRNTGDVGRCFVDNGISESLLAFNKDVNENEHNFKKDTRIKSTARPAGPMRATLPVQNMVKCSNVAKKFSNPELTETPKTKNLNSLIKPVAASTPSASVTPTSTVSNFRNIGRRSVPNNRNLLQKHNNLRSSSLSRVRVPSPDSTSGKTAINKISSPVVRPRNQQQTVGKLASRNGSVSSTTSFVPPSAKFPLKSIPSNTRSRASIVQSTAVQSSTEKLKSAVVNMSRRGKENILPPRKQLSRP